MDMQASMKKHILFSLILCSPLALSETKITPLDMELGYWVTTIDQSAIINKALEAMPEQSREMMRSMMEEKLKDTSVTQQCVTAETMQDFEKQIKETFKGENGCSMDVTESTSTQFSATMNCSGHAMRINTKAISSKRSESEIITNAMGMGDATITSVSEWKSDTCPAGL